MQRITLCPDRHSIAAPQSYCADCEELAQRERVIDLLVAHGWERDALLHDDDDFVWNVHAALESGDRTQVTCAVIGGLWLGEAERIADSLLTDFYS